MSSVLRGERGAPITGVSKDRDHTEMSPVVASYPLSFHAVKCYISFVCFVEALRFFCFWANSPTVSP